MAIFAYYYYYFCLLWGEGGLKKGQKSSYVVFECSGPKYEAKKMISSNHGSFFLI